MIDMNLQDISVVFHGVGGLFLSGEALTESQVTIDVNPAAIVVDLGANDLDSYSFTDPITLAEKMFSFLSDRRVRSSCKSVVIMQAHHRISHTSIHHRIQLAVGDMTMSG